MQAVSGLSGTSLAVQSGGGAKTDVVGSRDVASEHNELVKAVLGRDAAKSIRLLNKSIRLRNEHVRTTGRFAAPPATRSWPGNLGRQPRRPFDDLTLHRPWERRAPCPIR